MQKLCLILFLFGICMKMHAQAPVVTITNPANNYEVDSELQVIPGTEQVTTPAGTFSCFKIIVVRKCKAPHSKITASTVEYFSPEYGVIKIEFKKPKFCIFELVSIKSPDKQNIN